MLKQELDVDSELKVGPSGTFEFTVEGRSVLKKQSLAFPTEREIVDAVAKALGHQARGGG